LLLIYKQKSSWNHGSADSINNNLIG